MHIAGCICLRPVIKLKIQNMTKVCVEREREREREREDNSVSIDCS